MYLSAFIYRLQVIEKLMTKKYHHNISYTILLCSLEEQGVIPTLNILLGDRNGCSEREHI